MRLLRAHGATSVRAIAIVFAMLGTAVAQATIVTDDSQSEQLALTRWLDDYARTGRLGEATFANLDSFLSTLDKVAPRWIAAAPSQSPQDRRKILALVPLELASADDDPLSGAQTNVPLLEWVCAFLRKEPPTEFERKWMWASAGFFERGFPKTDERPCPALVTHLSHARRLFPDDSRFTLLDVLLHHEALAMSNRPGADPDRLVRPLLAVTPPGRGPSGKPQVRTTLRALEALTGDPVVGPEARAHAGLLKFHLAQLADAIKDLRAAARDSRDPFVQNLSWLTAGLALDAQGEQAQATEAYQSAVRALPEAGASATMLATHFYLEGDRASASDLLDAIYRAGPSAQDPWLLPLREYTSLPESMVQLRALAGLPDRARPASTTVSSNASINAAKNVAAVIDKRAAIPSADSGHPVFRTLTSGVTLDVLVRERNKPVTGLTSADLELLDNGVRQALTVTPAEQVELDVSLVVDLTYNPAKDSHAIALSADPATVFTGDIQSLEAALRPTDRLRLMLVRPSGPVEIKSLESETVASRDAPRGPSVSGRREPLYDAVAATLLRESPPQRRHVVIVVTTGIDEGSVINPDLFLELASASRTALHALTKPSDMETAVQKGYQWVAPFELGIRLWPPNPRLIETAAELTGGLVYRRTPAASIVPDFKTVLDTFRHGYVVQYTSTGVNVSGKHEISVTVVRSGAYEVHARKGYLGG